MLHTCSMVQYTCYTSCAAQYSVTVHATQVQHGTVYMLHSCTWYNVHATDVQHGTVYMLHMCSTVQCTCYTGAAWYSVHATHVQHGTVYTLHICAAQYSVHATHVQYNSTVYMLVHMCSMVQCTCYTCAA
jgi:hypothetical protein